MHILDRISQVEFSNHTPHLEWYHLTFATPRAPAYQAGPVYPMGSCPGPRGWGGPRA